MPNATPAQDDDAAWCSTRRSRRDHHGQVDEADPVASYMCSVAARSAIPVVAFEAGRMSSRCLMGSRACARPCSRDFNRGSTSRWVVERKQPLFDGYAGDAEVKLLPVERRS